MCSKSHFFPHKLLIRPPRGTVLTDGTEDFAVCSKPRLFPYKLFDLTTMWYCTHSSGAV